MAKRTCSLGDCDRPHYGQGFCSMHWKRWYKHGNPTISLRPDLGRTVEERFWDAVNQQGPIPQHRPELGPCWIWIGSTNPDGYGRFRIGNRTVAAYRYAWELLVGPFPEGLEPDHLCRVRACVRPIA